MIWLYDLVILVFMALSIGLDAYSDAYYDDYNKRHHWAEALSVFSMMTFFSLFVYQICWFNVSMTSEFILIEIVKVFGAYCLIRAGSFNIWYNSCRDNALYYVGTTDDVFDIWMNKLPNWFIPIAYILSLFSGIVLTFM